MVGSARVGISFGSLVDFSFFFLLWFWRRWSGVDILVVIFEVVVGGDGDWSSGGDGGRPDGGGSMYQFSCPMVVWTFGDWWESLEKM